MFDNFWDKLKQFGTSKGDELDITFDTYREEENTPMEEEKKPIAPIVANSGDADSAIELKVVRPVSFDEVSTIADYLLDGCTVVLNLELNVDGIAFIICVLNLSFSKGGFVSGTPINRLQTLVDVTLTFHLAKDLNLLCFKFRKESKV